MRHEATEREARHWWVTYGIRLRGFVSVVDSDGVVHWYVETESQNGFAPRLCDMMDEGGPKPESREEVSCMACVAAGGP